MQFHLNGYVYGDPSTSEAPDQANPPAAPLDEVDVLIVGCGPAGLTLASQLAAFPDIRTRIIDQKPGPLRLGQADGVACRTMEMFEAFGFSERVLKEAYWVNETVFWRPAEGRQDAIVRGGRIQDTEDGLSEFPHVILNQARVHEFFLDVMRRAPARLVPDYACQFLDLEIAETVDTTPARLSEEYPVAVRLERDDGSNGTAVETVRARFVVGCDGARSQVRRALGLSLHGDAANQAWGVMDVLAVTDFPDIRLKTIIHSAGEGSIIIIPREGGYLVRLYIELDKLGADERVADRHITIDRLIAAAQKIFRPYTLEVQEVVWWSVYEIGQRLCDAFDDVPEEQAGTRIPRVFIAGDACHTHSPKAGQGMNVSMQDGFNLGWKLASVIRGHAPPRLLHSYSAERHAIAKELIDFDRRLATMLHAVSGKVGEGEPGGVQPAEFQAYFQQQSRFTAGTATHYAPSLISAEPRYQTLASGFEIGTRFHSAPVIRLADAKPVQLGHAGKADGRWRLFLFSGPEEPNDPSSALSSLCAFLAASPRSPVVRYTPTGADIDAVFDVRAILQQPHRAVDVRNMPPFLLPRKGRLHLIDYEKVFCPDFKAGDIFDSRSINRSGCVVVVRPDQYVAHILPLTAPEEIAAFFDGFMLAPEGSRQTASAGKVDDLACPSRVLAQ